MIVEAAFALVGADLSMVGWPVNPMSLSMQAFVARVQAGATPADAAVAVGYPVTEVERLLADQRVRLALAAAQYPAPPVGRDDVIAQLDTDHALAIAEGQAGAAVAATWGKAKLMGLIVERSRVEVSVIDRLSPEAARALLVEIRRELEARRVAGDPLLKDRPPLRLVAPE